MLVTVTQVFDPECWYSELVGQTFLGFIIPNSPMIHFNNSMYFFPQDVEKCTAVDVDINYPIFNSQQIA